MEKKTVSKGFAIVVADRGWVYIGDVEYSREDGAMITNARNIRRWGTERGLGQLAKSGPTDETKLDDYGTVHVPAHAVMSIIDAERAVWTT